MDTDKAINELTCRIIGAAQAVSNTLGCGFLEKVYLLMNFSRPHLHVRRIIHN